VPQAVRRSVGAPPCGGRCGGGRVAHVPDCVPGPVLVERWLALRAQYGGVQGPHRTAGPRGRRRVHLPRAGVARRTAGTGTLGYTDPVSKVVIVVDPRLRDMDASNLGPPRIGTAIYFYWGSRAVIMNSVTN
jgi:hypothetical protein